MVYHIMGRRDKRRRESKKPKKDARKISIETIIQPSISVEVIKKGKKGSGEEEE